MLRTLKFILEVLFWIVAAAALLFGGALLVSLGLAPALFFLGIAAVLLALPLFMRLVTHERQRRVFVILSYLEQAVRLNLPLPRMIWAAQRSERGKAGYRLAMFRQRLEDGVPIAYALEMSAPEVPERHIMLLAAAERVGRLPHALSRLVDEISTKSRADVLDVMFYRMYPPLMTLAVSLVVAMVGIFVMPKFYAIFQDFGIKMPWITVATFDLARLLAPLVAMLAVGGILWMGARTLWETFYPMRTGDTIFRAGIDRLLWILPVTHSLQRDRGLADVFELLADAMDAGAPADRALVEAAELRTNIVLKGRLREWARLVADGQDLQSAARAAGMPPRVWGMLATTHNAEDLANVFRFLARYYRSRFSRVSTFIEAATVPLLVLIFGLIIACVALSLFAPMSALIHNMSAGTRGFHLL
jgi:type IV pilus assembly protein PilC